MTFRTFQFLVVRLGTSATLVPLCSSVMFQFLVVRLGTDIVYLAGYGGYRFQFLVVRLGTILKRAHLLHL